MNTRKRKKPPRKSIGEHMAGLAAVLEKSGYRTTDPLSKSDCLLFDARSRLPLLRFVSAIAVACPTVCIVLVTRISTEQLIIDFGSLAMGRLWQSGLTLFSGIYLYGMWWLSGKYVLRVESVNGNIHLQSWRIFLYNKTYVLPPAAFAQAPRFHKGRTILPFKPVVNAPYYTVRTPLHTFIIDDQGNFPEGQSVLLEKLGR